MSDKELSRVDLKTERLLLRPFRLDDVDDIAGMGGFPTWDLSGPKPYTRRHAEELVARSVLDPWDTAASFAIVLEGSVIGIINMKFNWENETATFGYSLGERHWGKGLTTEACRAVLSWGFQGFGLAKVSAKADERNVRSLRVMEKLGMQREGLSRSDRVIRGVRTGMAFCAVLRDEWDRCEEQLA